MLSTIFTISCTKWALTMDHWHSDPSIQVSTTTITYYLLSPILPNFLRTISRLNCLKIDSFPDISVPSPHPSSYHYSHGTNLSLIHCLVSLHLSTCISSTYSVWGVYTHLKRDGSPENCGGDDAQNYMNSILQSPLWWRWSCLLHA